MRISVVKVTRLFLVSYYSSTLPSIYVWIN